jgi:hypothetical protein
MEKTLQEEILYMDRTLQLGLTYCAWTKLGALTFSLVHPHLVLVTIRPTRILLRKYVFVIFLIG